MPKQPPPTQTTSPTPFLPCSASSSSSSALRYRCHCERVKRAWQSQVTCNQVFEGELGLPRRGAEAPLLATLAPGASAGVTSA